MYLYLPVGPSGPASAIKRFLTQDSMLNPACIQISRLTIVSGIDRPCKEKHLQYIKHN